MKEFADAYLKLLQTKYAGINLTRINQPDEFYQKQILDSLLPLDCLETFKRTLVARGLLVDVGFGGGFPIIPLAKCVDSARFLGVEARSKKVETVRSLAHELQVKNVDFVHARIEDIIIDQDCVVTFKAVSTVEECLKLLSIAPETKVSVYFYKGPNFFDKESLDKVHLNWDIIEEKKVDLIGSEGRLLIGFKLKNVPRGTLKKNSRSEHKLSKILKSN